MTRFFPCYIIISIVRSFLKEAAGVVQTKAAKKSLCPTINNFWPNVLVYLCGKFVQWMQGKTRLIASVVASIHKKTSVFPFSTIFRSNFFMNKETLFYQFDLTAYVVRGEKNLCFSMYRRTFLYTTKGFLKFLLCEGCSSVLYAEPESIWTRKSQLMNGHVLLLQQNNLLPLIKSISCLTLNVAVFQLFKKGERVRPLVVCSSYCFVTQ